MNKTKIAVGIFLIVLLFSAYNAWADGSVALGHTAFNSSSTVGEIGYEVNDWEFNAGLIGQGSTKNGDSGVVETFSISKLVKPGWSFLGGQNYYRIGVAYVNDSPLVGDTNFRLGVGLDYGLFAVEYGHLSSAGIHDPNTGIDFIQFKIKLPYE